MSKKVDDGLKGLAIASVVCAFASWFFLGILFAPLSVIFSILSLKSEDSNTRTLSTVGLVIGAISTTIMMIYLIILFKYV